MENQIKHVAARLKVIFVSFWLLPVLLIVVGETGGEWVGTYAADVRATYFAETLVILLVAICLPGEGRLRKELHINKEEEA